MTKPTNNSYADTVIVFDTNVLLTDSDCLLNYPGATIVIPETVLNEIDKLKTARVDPDLKYRGREISRMLFELADGQSLTGGVTLPEGGTLFVIPFENNTALLPDGFSTKTPDNKILATAYMYGLVLEKEHPEKDLVLITNDLNMLLKAQTLDIAVRQFGKGDDVSFGKKYIVRPFQRYRVPLTILMIAIAIFAAVLVLAIKSDFGRTSSTIASSEFRSILTTTQKNAYDALVTLQDDESDTTALLTLANYYDDRAVQYQLSGDNTSMIADSKTGIRYYERYLGYNPSDADARSDLSTLYYYTGDTDRAIQEISKVLESNPNHAKANYNLGVFYYYGRRDLDAAESQMKKVMQLTDTTVNNQTDNTAHALYEQAKVTLEQIEKDRKGETTDGTSGSDSTKSSTGN